MNKIPYESESKSSINMTQNNNNILQNFQSSSILNNMKSDQININEIKLNSNFDFRKYSSSSLYNEKTQDNHTKTNSINNLTNMTYMTNKTNILNNGYGILNLKQGFNNNLNKINYPNKYFGANKSYDFHYNTLGQFNYNYFCNNKNKMNNNNTQIFSNYNQMNNNFFQQIKTNPYNKNFNPYNNFINNKNNILFLNNFNKSQLSMNSLNNTNLSNLHKNMNFKNNVNFKNINNLYNNNKSKNCNEKLLLMLKSQNGSKSIQKKIEEKSNDFISKLYEQIKNNIFEIINDQYGNYVIQKLAEFCDKKILSSMLAKLSFNNEKNYLYETSINPYGTRGLQKILENLSTSMTEEDINIILKFTKGNIYPLIKDINGNHVIQSIIESIKKKDILTPIYKEMIENIVNILKTKSGSCCVLPKILNNNINEVDLDNLVNAIIDNIDKLINDENGNFSIQKIIKLNKNNYNNKIYNYIQDKIIKLSTQKFSSNVIETLLLNSTSIKDKIIIKILEGNNIINLLSDKFGNYIIQKILTCANTDDFNNIIKYIKNNKKTLKQTNHGKKIYEKLVKNYKKYLNDDDSSYNNSSFVSSSQNSSKIINDKKK